MRCRVETRHHDGDRRSLRHRSGPCISHRRWRTNGCRRMGGCAFGRHLVSWRLAGKCATRRRVDRLNAGRVESVSSGDNRTTSDSHADLRPRGPPTEHQGTTTSVPQPASSPSLVALSWRSPPGETSSFICGQSTATANSGRVQRTRISRIGISFLVARASGITAQ